MTPKNTRFPQFMYEHQPSVHNIANESSEFYATEQVVIDKGIFVYLQGVPRPQKGFADPQALWATNMAKRYFIENVKLLVKMPFVAFIPAMCVMSHKARLRAIQGILDAYTRIAYGPMEGFIFKSEFLCPLSQELRKFICVLYEEMGLNTEINTGIQFARVVSHMIQYDNAYRYRIQDIFNETSKERLIANPRKELKRLMLLMAQRDTNTTVVHKFKSIQWILSVMLFSKTIRNAFLNAIKSIDVSRMGFDEDDTYWVCIRTDYNFFGKSYDERMAMIKDEPKPKKVTLNEINKCLK